MGITNFAKFYGLFNVLPYEGDKDELKKLLVSEFTKGRTTSLREMTQIEYDACCDRLRKEVEGDSWYQARMELKKWRSAVLHQLQLIGVDTTDWNRVNAYCGDKRIAGKPFRDLTVTEMEKLLPKLRAIKRKMRKE